MVSQEIQEILELLSRQKNLIEAGEEIFKNLDKEQLCEYSIDLILKLNELEKSIENVVNGVEFASAGISLRFVKSFILYASNTIVKKTTSKTLEKTIESSNDTRKELKISDEDIRKIWDILIRMDLPSATEKAQKIYETFMDRFTDETEQRKNLVQDLIQALIKGIENDEVSIGAWTFLVTDARMWDYVTQDIFIRMLMNEQVRKEHLRKYNTSDCDSIFCKKTNNLVDMVKEITEENFPIRNFTFDSFRQQLTDFIERLSPEDSSDERINEDYAKFLFRKYLKGDSEKSKIWLLHEFIYHVLNQRPNLKEYFLNEMNLPENEMKLPEKYIEKWQKFNPEHNPFPRMPSLGMEEIEGVDWNKPGFLQLPKHVRLHDVQTTSDLHHLQNFVKNLLSSNSKIVTGLDTEWNSLIQTKKNKNDILQIAFDEDVYIIRVDKLRETAELKDFLEAFFSNNNILKIGHGLNEDIRCLRRAVPGVESLCEQQSFPCIMEMVKSLASRTDGKELENIILKLQNTNCHRSSNEKDLKARLTAKRISLTNLCEIIIGWPLDKDECQSVWVMENLRQAQKQYAALDAYAVLWLYKKCEKWYEELGINLTLTKVH